MRPLSTFLAAALALSSLGCGTESVSSSTEASGLAEATAEPPLAFSGAYRFASEVEPLGRMTVDVIDARMSDAAERLERAHAEGATCVLVMSNVHRCRKMHEASSVPASSLTALADRSKPLFASFGDVTSAPELVTEAESLVEWKVFQEGETSFGAFSFYRYLVLAGGTVKLVLPGDHESLELLVRDAGHLGKFERLVVNEGRWRWHEDIAVAGLSNEASEPRR